MLNQVNLQGRFGETPELKTTPSGAKVTSFRLAVQRNYKNQNEEYESDWISCVAWGNTAEFICSYFSKGQMVIVAGALSSRSYTDNDGKKVYVTEVVVNSAYFAGNKPTNERAASDERKANDVPQTTGSGYPEIPDDYPF